VRTRYVLPIAILLVLACAKRPTFGAVGEPTAINPVLTAVDTSHPPRNAWVQMDQGGYVALLLLAPGHSATLLYPPDDSTNNQLSAGAHLLTFTVPSHIARADSLRDPARARQLDSTRRGAGGVGRTGRGQGPGQPMPPIPQLTQLSLFLVTSPQRLEYRKILGVTNGVTIPTDEMEALNAVGKAIKGTISGEPRAWAGYYRHVQLLPP
jgi:hypothetical protein